MALFSSNIFVNSRRGNNNNLNHRSFICRIFSMLFPIGLFVILISAQGQPQHHHHHGHSHDDESANFKYSKATNEPDESSRMAEVKPEWEFDKNSFLSFLNDPTYRLWTYSIGSTIVTSTAPVFILFFIPVGGAEPNEPLLKVLLGFASGGLLGDAFLHLIPHAISANREATGEGHRHSHSHDGGGHSHDLSVGLYVVMGMTTFLVVEKIVRMLGGGEEDHAKAKKNEPGRSPPATKSAEMAVTGYLNLAADFTHNITDGLAVGASYSAGNTIGLVTTIAVIIHEVPHEIGDLAILVKSGCSKRKAMVLQLVTASGTLMGCILSMFAANPEKIAQAAASSWILPFTAGGFIYIGAVSIIPELLEDCTWWQSVKEVVAMCVGIGMMVVIAEFE